MNFLAEVKLLPVNMRVIYVLVDLDTLEVKYVGQTGAPERRFASYLVRARKFQKQHQWNGEPRDFDDWFILLLKDNKMPKMYILEEVEKMRADERETYWIRKFEADGATLFNGKKNMVRRYEQRKK